MTSTDRPNPSPTLLQPGLPHALVVMPASAPGPAGSMQVSTWKAPASSAGYGEAWIQDLQHALTTSHADLLVLPDPNSPEPAARALALTALEAARRHGELRCTWTQADGANAGGGSIEVRAPEPWTLPRAPRLWLSLPREQAQAARVSVIVRSMDRDTLGETLDSIAVQTHTNIEIVLVNALGSQHGTLPLHCGGWPVRGIAAADGTALPRTRAANLGLAAASGEMALFLDDDDLLLPDHLAKLVSTLQAVPDAVAAFADVEMGRVEAGRWQALHSFAADFDPTRLLFENYMPIHAVLFRRTPGLQLDEGFDLFEDWDFWLQLAQTGRFVRAPGVSARYRVHGLQQSNVFSDSPVAYQARAALYDKWRAQQSPERYRELLQQVQRLYRGAAQAEAELALTRNGARAQLAVLQARESDIESAARELTACRQLVLAREREVADAITEIGSLRSVLAAREAAAEAAATHASNLGEVLQAREAELEEAGAHARELGAVLTARDVEISHLRAHAADLEQRLARSALELQQQAERLAAREQVLAERLAGREQVLAELQAETPLLALKRTLRKKNHASTER